MKEQFLEIIRTSKKPLEDSSDYLKALRDNGVPRTEVYTLLESLRNGLNEEHEDILLEIMDIVSGWCLSDKEIW